MNPRKPHSIAGECASKSVRELIAAERARQRELLKTGKLKWCCGTLGISHDKKLRALTEELGEVAHALDKAEVEPGNGWDDEVRAELTQVAACAIAWLECLLIKRHGL